MDPVCFFHSSFSDPLAETASWSEPFSCRIPICMYVTGILPCLKQGGFGSLIPPVFQDIKDFHALSSCLQVSCAVCDGSCLYHRFPLCVFFDNTSQDIFFQSQLFIMMPFIVADIPEFGSYITLCPMILEYSGRIFTDVL